MHNGALRDIKFSLTFPLFLASKNALRGGGVPMGEVEEQFSTAHAIDVNNVGKKPGTGA